MTGARTTGGTAVDHRLAEKARTIAAAFAESRLMARRADPARWRKPRLLWPLFAKD